MNVTETIETRIKSFKASSSFTPGDPYCFSIAFSEDLGLPGKHDPVDYMRRVASDVEGKNVLVVCPGNSGLCVAALRAGASTVVAYEPRHLYFKSMAAVAEFTDEVIGTTFIHRTTNDELIEKFDVIFWAEGVDDISHPKKIMMSVVDSLAPGGLLYLEISHGTHGKLPDSTNCWRPSAEGVEATIPELGNVTLLGKLEGFNQTRMIYTIKNQDVRVVALPGPALDTPEEVKEFADKLTTEIESLRTATASKMEPFVSKEFIQKEILQLSDDEIKVVKQADKEREETVAKRIAEKIKSIIPTKETVGELDSLYEGRASTPKSKSKKAKSTPKSKKAPKKGKPKA